MTAKLAFNPAEFSDRICRLILAKAEAWKCSPSEAMTRLLDGLATKHGFTATPEAAK